MAFELHPFINACLNATSASLLLLGYQAIRAGKRDVHRQRMVAAFATSTVFLISYLLRFALTGTHKYPGNGWDKTLYLLILVSHMILAIAVVPLVLRSLFLAYRQRFAQHKRLVKFTWPIWMYVSVTGVVVYLMLYHLGPWLH
jgi:putative membrane protein